MYRASLVPDRAIFDNFFLLLLLLSDSWTGELSLSLVEEGSTFKRAIILYCLKVRLLFYTRFYFGLRTLARPGRAWTPRS